MALSPEEQRQFEEIRDWWKTNRVWIFLGVGLVLGGGGGYKGWEYWQDQRARDAAALYQQYRVELGSERARALGERLRAEYGDTSYALMASLISARAHQESQRLEEATRLLLWTLENSDDPLFTPVAALRLARVHAAQRRWEEGLAVLADAPLEGYEGLAREIRGDLYRGLGRVQEARQEYARALEDGDGGEFLEWKLAELGGRDEAD